jgi:adenylate kinase family enzyme
MTAEQRNGWILDGFPKTADHAKLLASTGWVPDHIVLLENEVADEVVRSRIPGDKPHPPVAGGTEAESTKTDEQAAAFESAYTLYQQDLQAILQVFPGVPISKVEASLPASAVASVTRSKIDPFILAASVVHDDAQIGNGANSLALGAMVKGSSNKNETEDSGIATLLNLGRARDYCPYELVNRHVLVKGKKTFQLSYKVNPLPDLKMARFFY